MEGCRQLCQYPTCKISWLFEQKLAHAHSMLLFCVGRTLKCTSFACEPRPRLTLFPCPEKMLSALKQPHQQPVPCFKASKLATPKRSCKKKQEVMRGRKRQLFTTPKPRTFVCCHLYKSAGWQLFKRHAENRQRATCICQISAASCFRARLDRLRAWQVAGDRFGLTSSEPTGTRAWPSS